MQKGFVVTGAVLGWSTVALGAFGAHGLEGRLPDIHLVWWDKAVHYQGLHAIALLACGLLEPWTARRRLILAGWAFVLGTLLFSGSLYGLALTGVRWLGAITPFGGISLLIGWTALGLAALRSDREPRR